MAAAATPPIAVPLSYDPSFKGCFIALYSMLNVLDHLATVVNNACSSDIRISSVFSTH